MSLLPKSHEEFSSKEYWDNFFKKRGNKAFEWYGEYPELCVHLHKYIKPKDNLLIVGCGNSSLGSDLYDIGHKAITNIDISHVVIRQMNQRNTTRPEMKYLQMDATNMSFENELFSVVLDKGTLDALMTNDSEATIVTIDKYFAEINRVLTNGGRYVCISLLQEHILKKILEYFPANNWMLRICRIYEPERKAIDNGESALPVFIMIMTKFKTLPMQVLEVNMGLFEKMERCKSTDEIFTLITSVQRAAFVCSGLKRGLLSEDSEQMIELFKPGETDPRYSVYVVDIPVMEGFSQYASFIVPQGREAEWLFSTRDGRKSLAETTKHNRLAIILLHRNQEYESLKTIQAEVVDIVTNMAPAVMKERVIQFLSLGGSVGTREVRFEGSSELSGKYIVEDVDVDGHKYRRLYYLNAQNVIQSEAKLIKSKNITANYHVDVNDLICLYHRYMVIATHMATLKKSNANVAVIGLGGGGLCSFMRSYMPDLSIVAVDIDKDMLAVATKWFGLKEDKNMNVVITDGLEYLKTEINAGKKYSSIIFDVDNKDSSIGMSCPPKEFIEENTLRDVSKLLDESGLFVLNAVIRDTSLRPAVLEKLKMIFPTILSYKMPEDLNEVFICSLKKKSKELVDNYRIATQNLNAFFKKKRLHGHVLHLEMEMDTLEINK